MNDDRTDRTHSLTLPRNPFLALHTDLRTRPVALRDHSQIKNDSVASPPLPPGSRSPSFPDATAFAFFAPLPASTAPSAHHRIASHLMHFA
jgi:hypothetical protein